MQEMIPFDKQALIPTVFVDITESVFSVKKWRKEHGMEVVEGSHYGYEYIIYLMCANCGEVISEYDSMVERSIPEDLSKQEAQRACEEIENDVKAGRAHRWFWRFYCTEKGCRHLEALTWMPPKTIDVLDGHGGFTAITPIYRYGGTNTLWRPGNVLKRRETKGVLQNYNPSTFFQSNGDVTSALYKVKGYRYPIITWFDNRTKRRIA